MILKAVLASIVNYVFPYRCSACSELTDQKDGVCAKCFQKLNFIADPYCNICGTPFDFTIKEQMICGKCISFPPPYDLSRSLFKFDEQSKKLVHAFKYNDRTTYAKMFARLLVMRYGSVIEDIDIIVPVPMHRFKRIFRNYNSSQILAHEIAKIIKKPMLPEMLIKQKWTRPQTGLSRVGRSKNLVGSIRIGDQTKLQDKVVLLVDDVKTTGATSSLCSRLLKKAGARAVKLVTISLTSS
jgi:ComF family protein